MKKIFFIGLIFATAMSCKKSTVGPQGEVGLAGPAGEQGPKGTGNQKVYFGIVQPDAWGNRDPFPTYTKGTDGFSNIDSTTFIIYIDMDGESGKSTHMWTPMPYTENGQTYSFFISSPPALGPTLFYTRADGGTPTIPTKTYDLKMVVIRN